MAIEENEVRQALGIDGDADPVAAIANMRADIEALKATISGDKATADKAAVAQLRSDLASAQRAALSGESVMNQRIAALEEERRQEKAHHKVENLVMRGKIKPAQREFALNLALTMAPDKFDEFASTLQGVDLTERGVASGSELAALEPTSAEMKLAKEMGLTRDDMMRQKAKNQGLTIPVEGN